ncbi:tRNA (5-methylaminomethyl-2-thiouridine)(34)-methyltransferase MnmD [Leptolyngbya ohadii]|uniref:tRNA (5-methylaminomethyl-2-thiouridine)(34)-methyltransferase MnmD n=1 Tax=Leptolyngbya ohadii TaxID=1962290 RepID=UPI000B59E352|nr:MnmC family methyltransferase [Leptolyngbya ohadii]
MDSGNLNISMDRSTSWIPQPTEDGSFTFFSETFGETFHSTEGARAEAFVKFAKATDLPEKAARDRLYLLDVCYGLGYNTAAALETVWAVNPDCQVQLYGLEWDATVPQGAIVPPLLQSWSPDVQTVLKSLAENHICQTERLQAQLLIGDARQTIDQVIQSGFTADAIFFDPFSPRRCPQLWTVEFFRQVVRCLVQDGKLATYSRSACVRSAMLEAGLTIGTIPMSSDPHPTHEWSQGTIAAWTGTALQTLTQMEQEHLRTRAAIPYRDPTLTDSAEVILARHQEEQKTCNRESTSSWRRRWRIT